MSDDIWYETPAGAVYPSPEWEPNLTLTYLCPYRKPGESSNIFCGKPIPCEEHSIFDQIAGHALYGSVITQITQEEIDDDNQIP